MIGLTVDDVLTEHSAIIFGANQSKEFGLIGPEGFGLIGPEEKSVCFSEKPVIVYQSTQRLVLELLNLQDVRIFALSLRANGRTEISSP
jgi:hypothetical protein